MFLYDNAVITGEGKLTVTSAHAKGVYFRGPATISGCTLDVTGYTRGIVGSYVYIRLRGGIWYTDLTIDNASVTTQVTGNGYPTYNLKSLTLKNCGIVYPAGAAFDAEKHQIIGTDGNEVTGKIVISNSTAATGDINADGQVNVTDVTALINRVLGTASYSDAVCDLNGDGVVNVSDVTVLINIILSNN